MEEGGGGGGGDTGHYGFCHIMAACSVDFFFYKDRASL